MKLVLIRLRAGTAPRRKLCKLYTARKMLYDFFLLYKSVARIHMVQPGTGPNFLCQNYFHIHHFIGTRLNPPFLYMLVRIQIQSLNKPGSGYEKVCMIIMKKNQVRWKEPFPSPHNNIKGSKGSLQLVQIFRSDSDFLCCILYAPKVYPIFI